MEIEFDILDLLQKLHTPIGDQVMCTITKLGNAGAIWIMLTLILLLIPKTRRCGAVLTVALIINTILCNGIIKPFVARPRPCDVNMAIQLLIPRPSDWSFPSGHTSAAFASASALFFHAYNSIGAAVSGSKGVTPLAGGSGDSVPRRERRGICWQRNFCLWMAIILSTPGAN